MATHCMHSSTTRTANLIITHISGLVISIQVELMLCSLGAWAISRIRVPSVVLELRQLRVGVTQSSKITIKSPRGKNHAANKFIHATIDFWYAGRTTGYYLVYCCGFLYSPHALQSSVLTFIFTLMILQH